jgi:hypothetical protein
VAETRARALANIAVTGGGGATGADGDQVFYENDQTITASYSIPADQNAVTAGPVDIDSGATVTIPASSTWTVV